MPTPTNNHIEKNTAQPSNSASWRHIIALVVILLLLRIIYLVWLSPYELAGDEAQYWDWSRNLDWSYYSKGPGVAWAIAAATRILGDHEWSIRLPAVLAWAISMLTIARLGQLCSGGDRRVGLLAALLFLLTPAYFAAGQFMTIDAPFFACWLLSILAAWHVFAALRHGRAGFAAWGALAATLGIGFLFKYTIALLLPGLILYAWLQRKDHTWTAKSRLAMLGCIGLIAIIISPVFIWNQKHGWPTLTHLFGHLHLAGGDVTEPVADAPSGFSNMLASLGLSLLRILEMIGTQIGIVGVPIMILIVHAVFHARRRITKHSPGSPSPPTSTAHNLLLICCALPVLVLIYSSRFAPRYWATGPCRASSAYWCWRRYMDVCCLIVMSLKHLIASQANEHGDKPCGIGYGDGALSEHYSSDCFQCWSPCPSKTTACSNRCTAVSSASPVTASVPKPSTPQPITSNDKPAEPL
jgi:4-amino-4-deoxy-L-arabinose transferase-like glycosyltransferase